MKTVKGLKKVGKYVLIILLSLVIACLIGLGILHFKSPGEAQPFVDEKGKEISNSISVIEKIEIGEIDQYLIIRGKDISKPLLLFLHGGPGTSEFMYFQKLNPEFEEDFVIAYWEQRATGKSYREDIPIESMTVDQFVSDTKEVTEYLLERFSQDKIYLMGHSWGTYIGIIAAQKYPQLYHCFFSVAQVVDHYENARLAHEWVLEELKARGMEKELAQIPEVAFPKRNASMDEWVEVVGPSIKYLNDFGGGLMHDYQGFWNIISPLIFAKEYTLSEKTNFMRGGELINQIIESLFADNLMIGIDSIQIPVYFLHGVHDYQTSYVLAKGFYERLKAPKKEFISFENSAHSPLFEEPNKFNRAIQDIIDKQ